MQTVERAEYPALKRLGSQIGYGIGIAIDLVLVVVVQNIEEWDFLPFLTERFREIVPWVTFSLIAQAGAYLLYIIYESRALRRAGEIATSVITIVVTWRVFTVYPFDFSAYEFPWDVLVRVLLVIAIVGASVGVVSNLVKLATPGRERGGDNDYGI